MLEKTIIISLLMATGSGNLFTAILLLSISIIALVLNERKKLKQGKRTKQELRK